MKALLLAAVIASVHTPTRGTDRTAFPVIDAHGGRVVWSDYDASVDAWRLMEHSGGATRAVPVAPRSSPFDVDLGPDGHGGTLAVYSRCRRKIPFDRPTPELQRGLYGCNVHAFSFKTGRETPVKGVNSRADETWPTVWGSRIAFARAYKGRVHRGTHIPFLYWRARTGARAVAHRLRLPATPRGQAAFVDGLDMRRRVVAYTWAGVDQFNTYSFIYRATTGGGLRPLSRGALVAGGDASSVRTIGQPALGAAGADWLFEDRTGVTYRAAFLRRYGGRGVQASTPVSQAVAFAHAGDTAYWIEAGPPSSNDPVFQPGGAFPLMADDAVRYRPVPRSWLPIRP